MATRRRSGANGVEDGVGDALQLLAQGLVQGLAQLQEALRLQKQEAERRVQEAERRTQEALRLQEQRVATALREMERKLQEKDDAIRALQQRLQETQERVRALEERTTALEGAGGRELHRLEGRVNEVEASLQRALQKFFPRVDVLLRQLEKPPSPRASPATAASARKAPGMGGAAAGGGEEPSSSTSTPTPSGAGHQGAASVEEERARQRVELRAREVLLRAEEARTSPSPLGEELCEAAKLGRLSDVRRLLGSGVAVNYTDRDGYTPIVNAACKAHADVVSLLLKRGAEVNTVNTNGSTALHGAAWNDRSGRCVELLLRAGADVDARDEDGWTPLHWAANWKNVEAVRALLAAGARRDLKPWGGDWKDKTPFDLATSSAIQNLLRPQPQK